jgi:GTP-binding protein
MKNPEFSAKELDRIFSGDIEFFFGANKAGILPPEDLPEVAFIGKSNVGKSSLINAITSRKSLARVSHTPGRTQQINFFRVRDLFNIIDLPGYGYAKVSKADHANWEKLILNYLKKRESLKLIFLLVDGRHGMKDHDREVMKLIEDFGLEYWLLFTKSDKIANKDRENLESFAKQQSRINPLKVFFVSSRNRSDLIAVKSEFFDFISKF